MIKIDGKEYKLAGNAIMNDHYGRLEGLFLCLDSFKGCLDEIVVGVGDDCWDLLGTQRAMDEWSQAHGNILKYFVFNWVNNWGVARNAVLAKTTADFVTWFDTDDTIVNAEAIVPLCEEIFKDPAVGAIWADYHFHNDKDGTPLITYPRERIVRKAAYKWFARAHETLRCSFDMVNVNTDKFAVKHDANVGGQHRVDKAKHGLEICRKIYQEDKVSDPTVVLNYAKFLQANNMTEESIPILQEYTSRKDVDDAGAAMGCVYLVHAYEKLGDWDKSKDINLLIVKLRPSWPDGYLGLGIAYFNCKDYDSAITFFNQALTLKNDYVGLPKENFAYTYHPIFMLGLCYFFTGRMEKALEYGEAALKIRSTPECIEAVREAKDYLRIQRLANAAVEIKDEILKENNETKLRNFVESMPDTIEDKPALAKIRNKYIPISEGSVAIYCGESLEPWGQQSVKTGIGGSEEAVINLARELVKLGRPVTVYNSCIKKGVYGGVQYKPFFSYDSERPEDIFIAWRQPTFLDMNNGAKTTLFWSHDVPNEREWTPARISKVNKFIVLSKFHQSLFNFVQDESKFFLTTNGINADEFDYDEKTKKGEFNFIYASSPVRGLYPALLGWPEIRKEFPMAMLHVYYNFTNPALMIGMQEVMAFENRLKQMLKELQAQGVIYHGRVGHDEIAKAFLKASYWIYPCFLFQEISCITAMKSQAAGCTPLTTTVGALDETVQHGHKIVITNTEEWIKRAIERIKMDNGYEKRKAMSEWAKSTYAWPSVAKKWEKLLSEVTDVVGTRK